MTIPQERIYQILSRMGGKWTILAISVLAEQPRRVNELKRLIGGISQQMLTRTLKALEHDGMVTRTVPPPPPCRHRWNTP
ncbi:winged helix-turn-helix transcriptional regulator [Ralstonia nicotianae]|uniref:winged helix-turn-helix transcriptional regulator n=1 Tax=Ralstonia solanacearum species complex TaxID=3116862 RepID=UPI002005C776|nr:helix-turn-helix domain-containing protein [Ralstonia pseudosolanacearum]